MAQSPAVGGAFQILAVTATLLPLVAVFLQLLLRVYDEGDRETTRGGGGAYFALLALFLFGFAGYLAIDVVKFSTGNPRLESAATALQMGIVFFLIAVLSISADVLSIFGVTVPVPDWVPLFESDSTTTEKTSDDETPGDRETDE